MDERRKIPRVAVAEPVIIVWDRGDVVGEIANVSSHGMFIALANANARAGTTLVVKRGSFAIAGVVRWADHRGIGVELDTPDEKVPDSFR